ncbi:MAG: gamma carbonic anhydrase family protein [Candidatus Hadarchaeales archaeon]
MIERLGSKKPEIHSTAFVHPSATVIGDVVIGKHSSVWPGAVIRGDFGRITIGDYTCVQDNAVIHAGDFMVGKPKYYPVRIGNHVIIGHLALVHGCTVEDECVIGGSSVVFNGAVVRKGSMVGLGAVVLRDTEVPRRTVMVGIPARALRSVTKEEHRGIKKQAENYARLAEIYKSLFIAAEK